MDRPMVIRYGSGFTAAGHVFVALTEGGICALQLVPAEQLPLSLQEVHRKFAGVKLTPDPRATSALLRQLGAVITGTRTDVDVALDLRGTPFQQRVWAALREVPRGATSSYTEIARRVGQPTAVRAVAGACARNPVAILVPCHRIVRHDGGLGGYRWGLDRKRLLLQYEQPERAARYAEAMGT